jgi:hypothetical protein
VTPPNFAEAEQAFRSFLKTQGWPTELIWVRAQDVRRGQPVLVYRSEETEGAAERDYEAARAQGQGLQLEALCTASGATCATVTIGGDGLTMTAAEPRAEGEVRWPFC